MVSNWNDNVSTFRENIAERTKSIHTPNRAHRHFRTIPFGLNLSFDVRRKQRYAQKNGTKTQANACTFTMIQRLARRLIPYIAGEQANDNRNTQLSFN